MLKRVAKYLGRHADLSGRPLVSHTVDSLERVVVIPALAEPDLFTTTLASLARNPREHLESTLVIAVINNGAQASAQTLELNDATLTRLQDLVNDPGHGEFGALNMGFIDASTKGNELSEGQGVGQARKIGMDWALKLLGESGAIFCLDADTAVEANYLGAVSAALDKPNAWATVIDYAHSIDVDTREAEAIVRYELFLRYHVLGLDFARSPYAFHTIGSAMALTSRAYVAISGMNKREAGEDFYFLQQLAKTGPIDFVHSTTVHPSSRVSTRTPFGTGAGVRQYLDEGRRDYPIYHPQSYRILRDWLSAVHENPEATSDVLLATAGGISPVLCEYLKAIHFCRTWERLGRNARDSEQLMQQFHRWFDGLKTVRFIHHLRDAGLPNQEMRSAISALLNYRGDAHADAAADERGLLDHLRALTHSRVLPAGIFAARQRASVSDRTDRTDRTDLLC